MECFAVAQVWALHKQIGGIVANEPVEVRISRRFQLPKLSAGIPPAEQARETLQNNSLSLSSSIPSSLSTPSPRNKSLFHCRIPNRQTRGVVRSLPLSLSAPISRKPGFITKEENCPSVKLRQSAGGAPCGP